MEFEPITISHKDSLYSTIEIHPVTSAIDIDSLAEIKSEFENGLCVINSQAVAASLKIKCVEGFVHTFAVKEGAFSEYIIRHCWNCVDAMHFDVTAEYIWKDIDVTASEFFYYPVGYFAADEYDFKNGQVFLSDAVTIAAELNLLLKEEEEEKREREQQQQQSNENHE